VSLSTRRLIRYGALGALCVVVVGGAVYLFDRSDTAIPATTADSATPRSAAKPVVNADEQPVPSAAQSDQAARLIGEAGAWPATASFPTPTRRSIRLTR